MFIHHITAMSPHSLVVCESRGLSEPTALPMFIYLLLPPESSNLTIVFDVLSIVIGVFGLTLAGLQLCHMHKRHKSQQVY